MLCNRPQDIRWSVTRLHFRLAHTGRRHTNTLVAARLQQQQLTSFFHGRSGASETVRSLSLLSVPGIAHRRNWNSCGRQQQHSSVILRHFCSTQHTSPTNYGMRHRANCKRRTIQMQLLLLL